MEADERFRLLGAKTWRANCVENLGLLAMEEGDLDSAQAYLKQALMLGQELGSKSFIALCSTELSHLYYLQGNTKEFKRHFRESLSLREGLARAHKAYILMEILGSLCLRKPKRSALLLGAIATYENPVSSVAKRYCIRAEQYIREMLGNGVFESAFAEGQKMSLDEALDLALKTVERM
jgi:tetratricopeptide (TPR) repeat protein